MPMPRSSLEVRDLRLRVRLGCGAEERSEPQEINVGVEIRFHEAPPALVSDRLEDTVCYAQLSTLFRDWCAGREFALVEKIAADLFQITKDLVAKRGNVAVTVHKISPPVPDLLGGVVFRVEDFD